MEVFREDLKKLGFGLMRLPRIDEKNDVIDVEQTAQMADKFLNAGGTYFDTAYVYGGSEEATRKALVERHDRSTYTLASKLNAMAAKDEADAKNQINVTLERLGTDHVDYYLLHALSKDNKKLYDGYGLWDYVKELKKEGKIRHYGFSFHDTADVLDELLTEHPDVEFVQLQINYLDWEDPSVQSRAVYETARKHGKPVIVMEPVKGGLLANPPESVRKIFEDANPDASLASWAIRFVASLDGVKVVLSGMSNTEQMDNNLSFMKDFKPLTDAEQETIKKAREEFQKIDSIKCTACHYCTPGCPMQIDIPDIFKAVNRIMIFKDEKGAKWTYQDAISGEGDGKASDCIQCGQCESVCPQHLPIIENLKKAAEKFD